MNYHDLLFSQVFYEEELDVPLVLFDEVLDHVLRIDRIFRQPQGHVLLIGISGFGKTTLSRFVAWMNGLSIYQIKVGGSSYRCSPENLPGAACSSLDVLLIRHSRFD